MTTRRPFPGTGNEAHPQPTESDELNQHRLEPKAPAGTGAEPGAASAGATHRRPECEVCHGDGLWYGDICPSCGGYGYLEG